MLVAAAFAPAKKEIIRTIEIEAPAKDVYLQVANFKKWEKWDPWMAKDTTQQRNYKGAFGSEDHSYSWVSDNKDVGTGHIEAAGSSPYSKFSYRLFFDENGTCRWLFFYSGRRDNYHSVLGNDI